MKQKALFIIFKGLSIKQITQLFLEGESLTLKNVLLCQRLLRIGKLTTLEKEHSNNLHLAIVHQQCHVMLCTRTNQTLIYSPEESLNSPWTSDKHLI